MKNPKIQKLIKLLTEAYEGPAWHGPAVKEVLKDIAYDQTLKSVGESHNIAELIYHMIAWRIFLIKKLQGKEEYDVSDEENFQTFKTISDEEWHALKQRLENSQKELIALLTAAEDDILDQKVGTRNYNFNILINGVIQHDLYHLGQIVLIKNYA